MSEKVLRIGDGFSMPAEKFLESATAIVGKRGRGKSGLVKRLEEEVHRVGLPFITFDPAGVHWAIKSSPDGKSPGLPVLVIGGKHGDVPLNRRGGAEIARAVVEGNVSCVIDLKQEPRAAYREFVRDFAHELFRVEGNPRVVFLEEATRLVPQKIYAGMQEAYEAVEKLVSQGRNEAIGVVMVTQRPATLNKDVLSEVDNLFIFGLVSPQDRKAIAEWVQDHDDPEKLKEFDTGLSALAQRECWAWSPEAGIFQKVHTLPFHTLHGDKTHLRKLGLLESKPVTVDVSGLIKKLGARMEALSKEKVDAAEVPRLRTRIRQLEADLTKRVAVSQPLTNHSPTVTQAEIRKAVGDAVAPVRAQMLSYREAFIKANARLATVRDRAADLSSKSEPIPSPVSTTGTAGGTAGPTRGVLPGAPVSDSHLAPKPAAPPVHIPLDVRVPSGPRGLDVPDNGEVHLKSGAIRILREIACRNPLTLTKSQLATLVGMTASGGTYTTYLSQLKRVGYLEEKGNGDICVTTAGLDFAGEVPSAPSTHNEVMERWRKSLKSGNARMLDEVVSLYPEPITKTDLATRLEMEVTGGTFGTYLSVLRRNNLVVVTREEIRASDSLFPERM